jgi:hypothetical protein
MSEQTLGERLVGAGLNIYNRFADRNKMPTNRRIFMESVVDKSKSPITEGAFKPVELDTLRNLILRKYAPLAPALDKYEKYLVERISDHEKAVREKNKDKIMYPEFAKRYADDINTLRKYKQGVITPDFLEIASGVKDYARYHAMTQSDVRDSFNVQPIFGYEDYGIDMKDARRASAGNDPRAALHTTLGRFKYEVDPKTGDLVVVDKYDFNPPASGITGSALKSQPVTLSSLAMSAEGIGGLYGVIRDYAGRTLPEGSGRDVRIRLNANRLAPPVVNSMIDR